MKTLLLFIMTAFIATGAIFAGLNSDHIVTGYLLAFMAWGLFLRRLIRPRY